MNPFINKLALALVVTALPISALQAQPDEPRITSGKLREEQRVVRVHLNEARKDLDSAKMDISNNYMRTAQVVMSRVEFSLSKAGAILEEHPVRIAKLRGLFISQKDRDDFHEVFEDLDKRFTNIEREYYVMVSEMGGGEIAKARMDFLQFVSSIIPLLEESDPELAAELKRLLGDYERSIEAGDEAGATDALKRMQEFVEANKANIEQKTGKRASSKNVLDITPDQWNSVIGGHSAANQAKARELMAKINAITDVDDRAKAEKLFSEYLNALQEGDTAAANGAYEKLLALLGTGAVAATAGSSTPPPAAPSVGEGEATSNVISNSDGTLTITDEGGNALFTGVVVGKPSPQVEYAGGVGKRITKEYDILISNFDAAAGTAMVEQQNVKIWSLEISENSSKRVLGSTLITEFRVLNDGAAGTDYTITSWKQVDGNGQVIRTGEGPTFQVEFNAAGTYQIFASGVTERGNEFEIGREYSIAEGILE